MPFTSLSYTSKATDDLTVDKLKEIIHTASIFNNERNITGHLCVLEKKGRIDSFSQWIEGKTRDIEECYSRIEAASSHTNLVLIYRGAPEARLYKDWSLQFETMNSIDVKMFMNTMKLPVVNTV